MFRSAVVSRGLLRTISARSPVQTLRFYSQTPENDDRMIGPYPHVKWEYYNERPQDIKYDDQQGRRNLGEPLHYKYDMIDVWSPDHFRQRSDGTAAKFNLYFVSIIAGFSGLCWYFWQEPGFVRRQYPGGLNKALGGTEQSGDMFKANEDKSY